MNHSKHYIVDTNVLLEDPNALLKLRNGNENSIYLPYHVLLELNKLKKDDRLGHTVAEVVQNLSSYPDQFKILKNKNSIDPELWAEIVYNYASAWRNIINESEKDKLLDSLRILWIGRFVSYAKEVKDMDTHEAEIIIQKQAEVFEEKFDYLRSIYEDPMTPT